MITTEPNEALPALVLTQRTHFQFRLTFLRCKLHGYCLTEEDLEGEGKPSRTVQCRGGPEAKQRCSFKVGREGRGHKQVPWS